jgi:hypothetical protein
MSKDNVDAIRRAFEVYAARRLGEGRVLSVIRVKGHGKFSKIEVDYRFVPVFTFREQEVVRTDRYGDRAEALAAAGPTG